MAETMKFDLVSPERRLASMQAREVEIPGAEGNFTAMPDHAATLATLRPGLVRATGPEGVAEFVVTGGFVEVGPSGASVLAEVALPRAEADRAAIEAMVAEAEAAVEAAPEADKDAARKRVADTRAIIDQLGL